ncbi:type II secretion system minor pseudopilin GspI [Idiomarina xiamenensis]|uniref:Type II secretion system protein I n=1 Tax=Idiomarina xiamenensis 10-D-4 TaxID=740709 RepID=K2L634_9GAMM|nr:type II secretion system minor pseudopilin GspI [Idiomarina xiamenensis]EKE85215.1 Type II secretory pathway, pseudopilin PulG-like protein [Idiomarina xiamenensis 10-D-4]
MKQRQYGFTLIEVMVALAIFAMAALAALKTASQHVTSLVHMEDITLARYVAANRLSELSVTHGWPIEDLQRGNEQMAGQTWYWQQQVVATTTNDVVAVTIVVSRSEDGDSVYQLTRYMGRR